MARGLLESDILYMRILFGIKRMPSLACTFACQMSATLFIGCFAIYKFTAGDPSRFNLTEKERIAKWKIEENEKKTRNTYKSFCVVNYSCSCVSWNISGELNSNRVR